MTLEMKQAHGTFIDACKQSPAKIGVEIGVHEGEYAFFLLQNLNLDVLYCVDPYLNYADMQENKGWKTVTQEKYDSSYLRAQEQLSVYSNKVVFVKKMSEDAVEDIPDSCDFIYIDGNHKYSYVVKDILLYLPKVRFGGILGGHDFDSDFPGVGSAISEMLVPNGYTIYTGMRNCGHIPSNDWWIIKG